MEDILRELDPGSIGDNVIAYVIGISLVGMVLWGARLSWQWAGKRLWQWAYSSLLNFTRKLDQPIIIKRSRHRVYKKAMVERHRLQQQLKQEKTRSENLMTHLQEYQDLLNRSEARVDDALAILDEIKHEKADMLDKNTQLESKNKSLKTDLEDVLATQKITGETFDHCPISGYYKPERYQNTQEVYFRKGNEFAPHYDTTGNPIVVTWVLITP